MTRKEPTAIWRLLHGAITLLAFTAVLFGVTTTAHAAGTAVFSAASPASGASLKIKPSWLSVTADDTSPIFAATMTINGMPAAVYIDRPVGHFAYDEEQESDVWVPDDLTVAKLMSYNPSNRLVTGANTVVATVVSGSGVSTYSWTFNFGSATTVSVVSPASGAVLPNSPIAISASLTSPSTSFTSTMKIDGAVVPLTYVAGTKTFSHAPVTALSAGLHTVVFTVRDTQGGTVSKTWSFKVQPPMSTGEECTSCHTDYPGAHPVAGCPSCHANAYAAPGRHGGEVPTAAGCSGDGGGQQDDACHRIDHASDSQFGIWGSGPFDCADCHNTTNPNVPRHTDASMTVVHASTSTACGPCHATSLVTEHAKYPSATAIKYQCELCHGSAARQQVKDAIAGGVTSCSGCHTTADHGAAHAVTAPSTCAATGCHTATDLTTIHAVPSCDGCHTSTSPIVVNAIATGNRECSACHPADPHPAAVHTAAGSCVVSGCHVANVATLHAVPSCAACHDVGKTPSLACTSCHTVALHATANHTSTETCDSCHNVRNLASIHGDNCGTCHPAPATGLTWGGKCSQAGCHPTSHTQFTTHQGDHGYGADCWDCHDAEPRCVQCHGAYDRTPPVTTSNAVALYAGTATITLSRTDLGGSGIRRTYYQLDGGVLSTGTVVAVSPPLASGTETHTLEFWSTDNDYNTEVHRRATFAVRTP